MRIATLMFLVLIGGLTGAVSVRAGNPGAEKAAIDDLGDALLACQAQLAQARAGAPQCLPIACEPIVRFKFCHNTRKGKVCSAHRFLESDAVH